jgi:hypothetical protein
MILKKCIAHVKASFTALSEQTVYTVSSQMAVRLPALLTGSALLTKKITYLLLVCISVSG